MHSFWSEIYGNHLILLSERIYISADHYNDGTYRLWKIDKAKNPVHNMHHWLQTEQKRNKTRINKQ